MFDIVAEAPEHAEAIETLYDLSFGPGRYAKTAYRLREDVPPITELCFVAFCGTGPDTKMMGSVRFSPVQIGNVPGLL
ncbi:MAG: hypothetical protein MI810_16645, partial [Flavobacteriales bacterium]|nr:hypothetical protein [Flavobacteriales bacterium]